MSIKPHSIHFHFRLLKLLQPYNTMFVRQGYHLNNMQPSMEIYSISDKYPFFSIVTTVYIISGHLLDRCPIHIDRSIRLKIKSRCLITEGLDNGFTGSSNSSILITYLWCEISISRITVMSGTEKQLYLFSLRKRQ